MFYPALTLIRNQFNDFLLEKWEQTINGTSDIVQIDNIGSLNDQQNDLVNKVIITLLKIEEDATLRNGSLYTAKAKVDIKKYNPPVSLNLYILISITKKSYTESLQLLSDTLLFFQSKPVFYSPNTVGNANNNELKFSVELCDLAFQDIFDMWSNLGGKLYPSAVYKIRSFSVQHPDAYKEVPAIKIINTNTDSLFPGPIPIK